MEIILRFNTFLQYYSQELNPHSLQYLKINHWEGDKFKMYKRNKLKQY